MFYDFEGGLKQWRLWGGQRITNPEAGMADEIAHSMLRVFSSKVIILKSNKVISYYYQFCGFLLLFLNCVSQSCRSIVIYPRSLNFVIPFSTKFQCGSRVTSTVASSFKPTSLITQKLLDQHTCNSELFIITNEPDNFVRNKPKINCFQLGYHLFFFKDIGNCYLNLKLRAV